MGLKGETQMDNIVIPMEMEKLIHILLSFCSFLVFFYRFCLFVFVLQLSISYGGHKQKQKGSKQGAIYGLSLTKYSLMFCSIFKFIFVYLLHTISIQLFMNYMGQLLYFRCDRITCTCSQLWHNLVCWVTYQSDKMKEKYYCSLTRLKHFEKG